MFEIGDWVHVPHGNVEGMIWFIDDHYLTVTLKCDLNDPSARCPYAISCLVVPIERWSELVVYPAKKIYSLKQLHKAYVGTSEKRTATLEVAGCAS